MINQQEFILPICRLSNRCTGHRDQQSSHSQSIIGRFNIPGPFDHTPNLCRNWRAFDRAPTSAKAVHASHRSHFWSWTQNSYNCLYPQMIKIPLKIPGPHPDPDHHQNRMVLLMRHPQSSKKLMRVHCKLLQLIVKFVKLPSAMGKLRITTKM